MREPKPYKCPNCVKSFANNSYLSQHMRIHLGIKPFGPCQYCGKKFTQLSHLQQHIRTHTGEKPYKCKYANCDKAFSQLSNLQSHSRCHQSDKPYKCNSCYKCFTDETALLDHIPKHKESKHLKASCAKEKVHICPFCGKSYTQSLYLEKHMAKHAERARASVNVGGNLGGTVAAAADLSRFPKAYYNGEFNPESFDGLNQLNAQLQSEEFAIRQFQMAAAAAQQNVAMSATTTAAAAAAYAANGISNNSNNNNGGGSSVTTNCYPSSAAAVAANNMVNQIGQIGNTTLSQLNFFQRSFQRNFGTAADGAGNNMQQQLARNNGAANAAGNTTNGTGTGAGNNLAVNGSTDRVAVGFNMITPLEEIKHFNQGAVANATAQPNFQ